MPVRFVWDPEKERRNVAKHGLDFSFAELVFNDPHLVLVFDRVEASEERWHAIGHAGHYTLLVVVHTYPEGDGEDVVRVIGIRAATRSERSRYEEEA